MEEKTRDGFKCNFCEAILYSKLSHEAKFWDWFTGYLPETVHICPLCLARGVGEAVRAESSSIKNWNPPAPKHSRYTSKIILLP